MSQMSLMPDRVGIPAEQYVVTDETHVHPASGLSTPTPDAYCTICGRETHDGTSWLQCLAKLRKAGAR